MSQSTSTYHYHTHRIDLSTLLPKKWILRTLLISTFAVPQVNQVIDGILHSNYGSEQVYFEAIATEAVPFEPLKVYTPYFYDTKGQTAQSYDFTLVDPVTNSDAVPVPVHCDARITGINHRSAGYGNHLEFTCIDSGHSWLWAHFGQLWVSDEWIAEGWILQKGKPVGVQGSTGNSTGLHVHAELDIDGDGATDGFTETEAFMMEAIAFWEAGVSPVAPMTTAAGPLLSDDEIKRLIGAAEGTVDWNTLEPDADYQSHADPCTILGTCPGRGTNQGYFSSDQGATPEEANAYQLGKIREAEQILQAQAMAKFGVPLSKAALANGLDLYNQAPLAALDEMGGYIDRLPSADPTDQEIIDARAAAFIDPRDGQLNAPGLGGTWTNTIADQGRRQGAIDHANSRLDQLREENRDQ
ncbi:MAG: M23 family metallopeptidase [Cyanobacteria bacterium P01_D01_bin.115]